MGIEETRQELLDKLNRSENQAREILIGIVTLRNTVLLSNHLPVEALNDALTRVTEVLGKLGSVGRV